MTAGNDPPAPEASAPVPLFSMDELRVQLISCSTRAGRFQSALGRAAATGALDPHHLNEILSAALSLEEAIAKMYAASGVAPSRSAAGG